MGKDISFKKALEKTIIEVNSDFIEPVWNYVIHHTRKSYIPPLFSEYTIVLTEKNKGRKIIEDTLSNNIQFLSLPFGAKEQAIDDIIKGNNLSNDVVTYYCVQYSSATEWSVTVFEGQRHTKTWIVECSYINEPDEYGNNYAINVLSTSSNIEFLAVPEYVKAQIQISSMTEYAQCMGAFVLDIVNVISYYMQHYNPDVAYSIIKATPLSKIQKERKVNGNLCYEQKIVLKSKIKKYVLTSDTYSTDVQKIRTYRKTKPCWYVRGYYQHFGQEKILKYIPPRINYRKNVSHLTNPKPNTYQIKE